MLDLPTVLCTSEVKCGNTALWLAPSSALHCFTKKTEDLRCCVLCASVCTSSLCNTSSSHLLTGRKCFPPFTNADSTHTIGRSIPVTRCPSPADGALQREKRLDCVTLVCRLVWSVHRHPVTQRLRDAPPFSQDKCIRYGGWREAK